MFIKNLAILSIGLIGAWPIHTGGEPWEIALGKMERALRNVRVEPEPMPIDDNLYAELMQLIFPPQHNRVNQEETQLALG